MKTLGVLKRAFVAAVVALTLGLALAPVARASADHAVVVRAEQPLPSAGQKQDGQETHG